MLGVSALHVIDNGHTSALGLVSIPAEDSANLCAACVSHPDMHMPDLTQKSLIQCTVWH